MSATDLTAKIEKIAKKWKAASTDVTTDGAPVLLVPGERLYKAAEELKGEGFDLLHSITGVDYADRIEVVYHLFSTQTHAGVVLKATLAREGAKVASVVPLWITADWHERETGELLGIEFTGHPDPRYLLLAEDFPGSPLRKDWAYDDLEEYLLK